MNSQLSLFNEPEKRSTNKKYIRDKVGRFATKERAEIDKLMHEVEYYKLKYEAEYRKNKPILKLLFQRERELNQLKNEH